MFRDLGLMAWTFGLIAVLSGRPRLTARMIRPAAGSSGSRRRLGSWRRAGAGEGEHRHLGQEFAGQGGDLAPDLVLVVSVQGQVPQAGVLSIADPVLAASPAAVP
jgi:hypothetical protein